MHEIELKSVVDDLGQRRHKVQEAGGQLLFAGWMVDRHYASAALASAKDILLRVRTYRGSRHTRTELTWKGPALGDTRYKVREELTTAVADDPILMEILARLGFTATWILEREVSQYSCAGALVRFEQFPLMDTLVEVEGEPDAIERAIQCMGLPRAGFTSERLKDFVRRFEERTGRTALLARSHSSPDASCSGRGLHKEGAPLCYSGKNAAALYAPALDSHPGPTSDRE